jgi:hypothetical protein
MRPRWLAGDAFVFLHSTSCLSYFGLLNYEQRDGSGAQQEILSNKTEFSEGAPRIHRALRINVRQPGSKILWQLPNTPLAVFRRM